MVRRDEIRANAGGSGLGLLLLAFVLLLGTASSARAEPDCSDYPGGVIDGATGTPDPSQLQIDRNCTIRNFPGSNPFDTNISFLTQPGQTDERWLVIFDNVVHTGEMACNSVAGHTIWFTNGSSTSIKEDCQNLLIPVEKIDKENPEGQTTAAIGVPFTYTLTVPVLFDPATSSVINAEGSPNDLHSVTITDDLNATGADLTYLSHTAYWRDSGAPVPHTFSNQGGLLTFDDFPVVPAGDQFVLEITVVLDDTPANAPGTQFVNTAKWDFGRLIDGVFHEPLPGEWGVTPPMTIAAPELVMTKTGPATLGRTLNLGQWGEFTLDVHNTGLGDAWDVTLLDRLPDGPTGGMCDLTPELLSAQVFQSDGATPVPGKGPLVPGSDFSMAYDGPPTCELRLTMLTPAAAIGPGERLRITYRTQLDPDTENGVTLTNVAGATRWFNADASEPDRQASTRTLTDGSVGVLDHEDAHTVTAELFGHFFEKSVANLTTGVSPAATAAPGDRLRYTLRLQTTDVPLSDLTFRDDLGALNATPVFVPGSLSLVAASLPAGADTSGTDPAGGTNGAGILDVGNLSAPAGSEIRVQLDITLQSDLADGTVVLNQADLVSGVKIADSDDPNINGQADPEVEGDEDPTRVVIATTPADYLFEKTAVNTATGEDPATAATPGDRLRYRVRLVNQGDAPLEGLRFHDELDRLNDPAVFEPGTLELVTVPAGADAGGTRATGGARGTGVVDVRGLRVGPGESVGIEFEVTLAPAIADGTLVTNQSQLFADGAAFAESDDPNVNGPADPFVDGDEDPTRVRIGSAPDFRVEKVSAYVDGDPDVLLAGETLRYTITVKNVGTDDAGGVTLRDAVPVSTEYVPGSTTLNGEAVPDGPSGLAPLSDGIPIHAPEDPTPGSMPADASDTGGNVATVVFDVVVDPAVADGTVISNQAFVSAPDAGISDVPSDDPRTPIADDPTRDVVGNVPLLFAPKSVELGVDAGSPGIVDPGDVLHYTIAVHNSGNVPATGVVVTDEVPADTTYVADSTTLNGLPVGQPDGGAPPLASGLPVSSSDLTPPLPGAGGGTLSPGESALLEFDLRVDDGVPAGTIISNQGVVQSEELLDLLTDGDGDPTTGPEPTVVVVGDAQQLAITKDVTVVGGGPALPGSQLEYVVRVTNIASVPALEVRISDDLDLPVPGQLAYVEGSATLDGRTTGVGVSGSVITADYAGAYGPLPPEETSVLRFRAVLDPDLASGTTVTNTAVVTWSTPEQSESASVSIDVGGVPGVGTLSGRLWHDADFDKAAGAGERRLEGWTVELLRDGRPLQSVVADAGGAWRIAGVAPNDATDVAYALRFSAPGAGADTASLGTADSAFTDGPQEIRDIQVASGANLEDLNLPITPNGVVYDSVGRSPVAGATLALLTGDGGARLPAACFDDPAQQGQVTLASGYYKLDLSFSDPACPSGGDYLIGVAVPGSGYIAGRSRIIPPASDASTTPFSVPLCPGGPDDAVPATPQHCEVQASELPPPTSVAARSEGTEYHVHLTLDDGQVPGSSQIFNNHIPLDPALEGAVGITKTASSLQVRRGELVPYEITFTNGLGVDLPFLSIVDRFPAGFRYKEGSARIDGVPVEPTRNGRELVWSDIGVEALGRRSIRLLLSVGAGVTEGEFVNRAQAVSSLTGEALSGEATATVRVVPDFTFDCTDVIGKVFADANRNGVQDRGERGLAGVRLATLRGLVATTDPQGRFHITCAMVPREDRGGNFALKLDTRTLPSGYRMTTRPLQVQRATRGKVLRFHFGASIHRVVSLDLADAVFEPGGTEMRVQWRPRLGLLLDELEKGPAILRLSYLGDLEDPELVERRLEAVRSEITEAWQARQRYRLTVETEVFWRRGGPPQPSVARPPDRSGWRALLPPVDAGPRESGSSAPPPPSVDAALPERGAEESRLPSVDAAPPVVDSEPGESVERHLPSDEPFTLWAQDPEFVERQSGDTLEEREVLTEEAETVKLKGVVPPIRFESGVADIPPSTIRKLRVVLDSMRHLDNVRLHLVGHADDQPLSEDLARVFGDNAGLSRERAGEVAEFIQTALGLPPEAISFEWAGATQPIATNATAAGRALNRRVEVEVWYDEIEEKRATQEVVVPEEIKRFKVCRVETVCKLRYREGHEHRARVRNLIPPFHYGEGIVGVPDDLVRQVREALHNLRDRRGVTVKLVGFTDDVPLEGREKRIYGTHLALSKARARRVALAVQDALDLPSAAVASDGRGSARPVASNETARGRALNRRVEVELWYDDPLQELPDEPQPCPDPAGAELVTKVYDPPWGRIPALQIEDGEPVIPPAYTDTLRRALEDVAGRTNARLRFVGYTANKRLDRRTARVYGDDIGLATARARRAMEKVREALGLSEAKAEHEGRGYVHSDDVVNAGFVQAQTSYVAVQVVYDEPAPLDDPEGVEITPITRELGPKNPLALNLMRISVDGEPIDDPGRSRADVQRCTDVALDHADIEFRFDGLEAAPRLSVTARPIAAPVDPPGTGSAADGAAARSVRFRMYTNYGHFIERSEVRIFEREQSLADPPLAVVEIGPDGLAEWRPSEIGLAGPVRELKYVLRAYDEDGRFDETSPQSLWMVHADPGSRSAGRAGSREGSGEAAGADAGGAAAEPSGGDGGDDAEAVAEPALKPASPPPDPLLAGYGESGPLARSIPLGNAGSVEVHGDGIPPQHSVWVAGSPVPVNEDGRFVAETLLPAGLHTVEVAVLDEQGNGELFLRDLEIERSDWFYMGMADLTVSADLSGDRPDELVGEDAPHDPDSNADSRLAFYVTGKFGEGWGLTASADTREEPLQDLFSHFMDKSPQSLFRRIDPEYHYPTFGDGGTVEETAPTLGKLYLKLDKDESHALWGSFKVDYLDNELAHVDRGLYGANLHYQSLSTTDHGEQRLVIDGFAAEPGTVPSREELLATGGSLYYLRRQDLLAGSERVRVEIRDKTSGLVTSVVHLQPTIDYDIDYLQGRILLTEPISAHVDDDLLVRSEGLSGNEAWLVVQYEYTPGFDEIDALAAGGQGHAWLNDFVKLGLTANRNDDDGADSSLYAADLTLRKSARSWLKLQAGRSEGLVSTSTLSRDGGFTFLGDGSPGLTDAEAFAWRADASLGVSDLLEDARGRLSLYVQRLEGGYTAPGMTALTDTDQIGGRFELPVADRLHLTAKADWWSEEDGIRTQAQEVDLGYELTDHWSLGAGVRNELREDDSPIVPLTQEEGRRTDGLVQLGYDSQGRWRAYTFGQATLAKSEDREGNSRAGVGGAYRVSDRLALDGEISFGDLGPALQLGSSFQQSQKTRRYLSYAYENERSYDGLHQRKGTLISGAKTRLSDSSSVYVEDRYEHGNASTGLARAMGFTLAPSDRWSVSGSWQLGTLIDARTHAEIERNAGGARAAYGVEDLQLSTGVEYRFDETEQPDGTWTERTTWLFRNDLRYQVTPGTRLIGKLNHSFSDSSEGQFFDGGYTEAVLGYAWRPVQHDRLHALARYTYFYNVPATDQVTARGGPVESIQKSHVAAADITYDLTPTLSIGGKYAWRLGQVSLDREDPDFFDNDAHLFILRADWRFLEKWEASAEQRMLQLPDLDERRSGALVSLYRYVGDHLKLGLGYNFTDFSEDLTDLSYDHHGLFLNLVGTL